MVFAIHQPFKDSCLLFCLVAVTIYMPLAFSPPLLWYSLFVDILMRVVLTVIPHCSFDFRVSNNL